MFFVNLLAIADGSSMVQCKMSVQSYFVHLELQFSLQTKQKLHSEICEIFSEVKLS